MGDTQTLVPAWTEDDYYTTAPYKWLADIQNQDKFLFINMFRKCGQAAVAAGVPISDFKALWKEYTDKKEKVVTVIGSNETRFTGQEQFFPKTKYLQCGVYDCSDDGVTYFGTRREPIDVISHPLLPIKRIVDVESNAEMLQIAYSRMDSAGKNRWRKTIVSRDVLASAQKIIALAKNGVGVNSENAKEVVKYISCLESLNYTSLEEQRSCSHMGWLPDGQFAPFAEDIVYGGDNDEFQRLYNNFHEQGNEQKWLELAKQVRSGDSIPARIALAASFAAPLISVFGALSFFVHFWGQQGTGKTVALMLAASVWGKPDLGGYIKSFSGTKNSQEINAAFCCNLPIFLDELQVISDRRIFDEIIYMLCEGFSKGRGSKDGGLQAQRRWSTVIMSTGEMPIVQSNSGGGAAVRTIEVEYGGQPFFQNAPAAADTLKKNYGFAGRKFIEALKDQATMDALIGFKNMFSEQMDKDVEGKQVISASILLAADALADAVIFHDGKSLKVKDIKDYLVTKTKADVNARCYQYLIGWVASNQARFSSDREENNGQQWGIAETDNETGKEIVYIIRDNFERALRDGGYSPGAFLSWAKQKKLLKTKRFDSNTIQKTIGTARPLCVAVFMPPDDEANGMIDVTGDDPLPF